MVFWLIILAANLTVGLFVGMTGVAGFLLPMLYAGSMGMSVPESLSLSFAAFLVSGVLGAFNYYKAGNLNFPFAMRLSTGSLAGAVLGVKLNMVIPEDNVKLILYLVVLLSGISILMRKESAGKEDRGHGSFLIAKHLLATLILGFLTGLVCALSGAGGPVLVMPLLVVFGIDIRTAIGVSLLNSVFIGIPACIGYMAQCSVIALLPVLSAALAAHGLGVYIGSKNAVRINQTLLKKGIAVFSIIIAVSKLFVVLTG